MTDRDKDLARLELMVGARRVPGISVVATLACTGAMIVLAFISSQHGNSTLILVALLAALTSTGLVHQYYVYGPLFREMQRLRAELEELRGRNDAG